MTIGPNGKVSASVKAREVVVLGTIHGNVEARDKVEIRKTKLVGDIRTARIVIDDGAYLKGNIDITRRKPPKSRLRPNPCSPFPRAMTQQAPAASSASSTAPARSHED